MITTYSRLGGLKSSNIFCHRSGTYESKIKVLLSEGHCLAVSSNGTFSVLGLKEIGKKRENTCEIALALFLKEH